MQNTSAASSIVEEWHIHPPRPDDVLHTIRSLSKSTSEQWTKAKLWQAYLNFVSRKKVVPNPQVQKVLRSKPIRTLSGVAPVTVLTKPFPCPGQCIFCPNDIRMPKSYLADEPGAQRAERNWFDPYLQTYNRLEALSTIGHHIDKVEIIILGGTWSFYPMAYQKWFVKECFQALNDFGQGVDSRATREEVYAASVSLLTHHGKPALTNDPIVNEEAVASLEIIGTSMKVGAYNRLVEESYAAPERRAGFGAWQTATWQELEDAQQTNESAAVRCVGLVLETRPDAISPKEVVRLRRLGATKVQIGVQSLDDDVLKINHRGHLVQATKRAFVLLRSAGFKIHAHWMANLLGSNPTKDTEDFQRLFTPPFCPDELKIYPCSLLESAELMQYYRAGSWRPYSAAELARVVSAAILVTPAYCRLTRIIRDIPSQYIVTGNKQTNFRQIVEQQLKDKAIEMADIRSRELRHTQLKPESLIMLERRYKTASSQEIFLEWNQSSPDHTEGNIVGFLRLSLPTKRPLIHELEKSALVRELHIYGQLTQLGKVGVSQHLGLGAKLLVRACQISAQAGYNKLAVISAIGTKEYYRKQGFVDGELYQFKELATI